MKLMKNKTLGGYLLLIAAALTLLAAILYAAFGVAAGTFSTPFLLCLLGALVLEIAALIKETALSDFFSIGATVLLSLGLTFFVRNSVGDFTELITPVGMYGNPANMPMRFVILAVVVCAIVLTIVEGFMKREKAK